MSRRAAPKANSPAAHGAEGSPVSRESQDIDLFNGRIDHDRVCLLPTHLIDPFARVSVV